VPLKRVQAGLAVALLLAACGEGPVGERPVIPVAGDPRAGREAIISHGCGSCHRIPGIPEADALVGPPLDSWSGRAFIVGTVPNSPDNLATFLEDPAEVRPGTAMPDLRLTDEDVASIVAYLFTLE
jgi:cytochrome c